MQEDAHAFKRHGSATGRRGRIIEWGGEVRGELNCHSTESECAADARSQQSEQQANWVETASAGKLQTKHQRLRPHITKSEQTWQALRCWPGALLQREPSRPLSLTDSSDRAIAYIWFPNRRQPPPARRSRTRETLFCYVSSSGLPRWPAVRRNGFCSWSNHSALDFKNIELKSIEGAVNKN